MSDRDPWPAISHDEWAPTQTTLHLYTQMLGKLRLALHPPLPEWLHAGLQLDARGFATGPLPCGERVVTGAIDVIDGALRLHTSDGQAAEIALTGGRSVAQVWADFLAALSKLGVSVNLWDKPQEIPGATLFSANTQDRGFEPEAARRYHELLCRANAIFEEFRSPFFGRSGVQFWWGSFDLAVLLFNGRPVTAPHDRGYIMEYDLDAEHLNAGLWPGDKSSPQPLFYAYLHPRPDGCETASIEPDKAGWVEAMGEWLLPYDEVRSSADPRGLVLAFLNSVYRIAVTLGGWDANAHRYTTPPPGAAPRRVPGA
jgi:Family of unknown function (DUF5996)